MSLSKKGDLYVFNKNLILQNGFPIKGNFIDNIFSMNIINDKFPEIILKDIFGRINILDMDGRLKLTFPSDSSTSIIMIGEFMEKILFLLILKFSVLMNQIMIKINGIWNMVIILIIELLKLLMKI